MLVKETSLPLLEVPAVLPNKKKIYLVSSMEEKATYCLSSNSHTKAGNMLAMNLTELTLRQALVMV